MVACFFFARVVVYILGKLSSRINKRVACTETELDTGTRGRREENLGGWREERRPIVSRGHVVDENRNFSLNEAPPLLNTLL